MNSFATSLGSYWFYYLAQVVAAFVVSPYVVRHLGAEGYGIWSTLLSAAGYLTILDLGIHAALVRQIALVDRGRSETAGDGIDSATRALTTTFSTAFTLLIGLGALVSTLLFVASPMLVEFLGVTEARRDEALLACRIVAIDLGIGLFGAAFLGVLAGLRRFVRINLATIGLVVVRSIVLVWMLERGAGLVSVALVQLSATLVKHALQFAVLRREVPGLRFRPRAFDVSVRDELLSYGAYALLIVLALKVLLYTDSLVIARCLSPSDVTYYAVPASLLEHVERLALAAVAVLVPFVSATDSSTDEAKHRRIWLIGTRYAALLLLPISFTIYAVGGEFLGLWMGDEIRSRGGPVLSILAVAQFVALPQLLAHGILKGTGRVRFLALALLAQAATNLVLSLVLVRSHGLTGVAIGTAIPLVVVALMVIPIYLCRTLEVSLRDYLASVIVRPALLAAVLVIIDRFLDVRPTSYWELAAYAASVSSLAAIGAVRFGLEPEHRVKLLTTLRARLSRLRH